MVPSDVSLADLVEELAALRKEVAALRTQLAARDEEVSRLRTALEGAQRAGKRQSAPFSKKPPKAEPKKPGRKPGKDYGRKERRRIPERVDETFEAPLPSACPDCGGGIRATAVEHQYQTELPRIVPVVRQFDVHVGLCRCCGKRVQGRHPQQTSDALGAAASQLGPRALALASQLQKQLGLSYGKVRTLFKDLLGIEVSRGGLSHAVHRVATRLFPTYEAMRAALTPQPTITADETGWRVGGVGVWLWAFVSEKLSLYAILSGRGFEDALEVLPASFAGNLVRDGWAPYRRYEEARHQTCLTHLLRRCHELLEVAQAGAARVPHAVRRILRSALDLRDRRDAGDLTSRGMRSLKGKLDTAMERLLAWKPRDRENRKLLAHLRTEHELGALFHFLDEPGLPATNHLGEQAIRPAVVNRKVWGGNRTWNGAMAQQVLTSFFATAHRQGLDHFRILTEIVCSPHPKVAPFLGLDPPPLHSG